MNSPALAQDTTKIEWTAIKAVDGRSVPGWTFNPWEGCAKVSAGCKKCYAETQHNLYYSSLKREGQPGTCWGIHAPRLARVEPYWRAPLRWNKLAAAAQATGLEVDRRRVFCASMADVFEVQSELSRAYVGETGQVPTGKDTFRTVQFVDILPTRLRLLRLIHDTPHLDWLLLTKRPENIMPALKVALATLEENEDNLFTDFHDWLARWVLLKQPPLNVWLGTSVEHQAAADERIQHLLAVPAARYFLSCEPLLGPVELPLKFCVSCARYTNTIEVNSGKDWGCARCKTYKGSYKGRAWAPESKHGIDWVVVGGESGHDTTAMRPEWVRSIQEQCKEAEVAFFFKQMGSSWAKELGCGDKHGGHLDDIPAEFRVRQSPASKWPEQVLEESEDEE